MCIYSLWQPKFQTPISLYMSGFGDYKVARVGRPTTDYKLVGSSSKLSILLINVSRSK